MKKTIIIRPLCTNQESYEKELKELLESEQYIGADEIMQAEFRIGVALRRSLKDLKIEVFYG